MRRARWISFFLPDSFVKSYLWLWTEKSKYNWIRYKCAVQKPWWSLHQLLSPSQSKTTDASRGQDQEQSHLPTRSYAMEEDTDVTSHTEVILLLLWSLRFLMPFQLLGWQQPYAIKLWKALPVCWSTKWKQLRPQGSLSAPHCCIMLNNDCSFV